MGQLDDKTIHALKELDHLNNNASEFLKQVQGRSRGIYSMTDQISEPHVPNNRQESDSQWRDDICANMPLYFNMDGSRTANAMRSKSSRNSIYNMHSEVMLVHQYKNSLIPS